MESTRRARPSSWTTWRLCYRSLLPHRRSRERFAILNLTILDPGVQDSFALRFVGRRLGGIVQSAAGTTDAALAHQYAENGSYTVDLWLLDDDGGEGFASTSVVVTNSAPVISGLG